MNKKVLNALLLGALVTASAGTFTSCKDYDDDIERLEQSIQTNADAIKKLQELVGNGQFLTGVTKSGNDLIFSVSNGTSITVASVDGKDGKDGTVITIDPTTNNWLIDGVDTGICAKGEKGDKGDKGDQGEPGTPGAPGEAGEAGEAGAAGKSPIIGDNGNWFVWDAEAEEYVDTEVSTDAKNYAVNMGLYWELHMVQEGSDELAVIKVPSVPVLTSIKVLADENATHITDYTTVTLNYGSVPTTLAKDVTFNGVTYKRGAVLIGGNKANVYVQLNPVLELSAVTAYEFSLLDSKGNSIVDLGTAKANESDDAITRATANQGLFVLPVEMKSGLTQKLLDDRDEDIVYAVATRDYNDNLLLSEYCVKVETKAVSSVTVGNATSLDLEVGTAKALAEFLTGMDGVVDYTVSYADANTKKAQDMGITIASDKKTVSATSTGSFTFTYDYLDVNGNVVRNKTITINFIPAKTTGDLSDFAWTINTKETWSNDVDVTSLANYFREADPNDPNDSGVNILDATTYGTAYAGMYEYKIEYANGDAAKFGNKPAEEGFTGFYFYRGVDDYGYTYTSAWFEFDPEMIAPTTFKVTLTLKRNGNLPERVLTTTVDVHVDANFDFKPLAAFFDASLQNATAYGQPNAAGNLITYDLYSLFNVATADKDNVYFAETVPASYKDKDGNNVVANAWLSNKENDGFTKTSTIAVIRADAEDGNGNHHTGDGVGVSREFTVKYVPFGNTKITPVTKTFNVTVVSEVAKGAFSYINWNEVKNNSGAITGYTPVVGTAKKVTVNASAELALDEISAKDVYGNDLFPTRNNALTTIDSRVESVTVTLNDDNAKQYLKLSSSTLTTAGITISSKAGNTAVTTAQQCELLVTILDKWGVKSTVTVPVTFQ